MNIINKMSAKTIVGQVKKFVPKDDTPIDLFTVYGIATGSKTGQSTFGEWSSITGNFRAVRTFDGEEFQGPNLFLPNMAQQMVLDALAQNGVTNVEIAFIVGIKANDSEQGYEYTVKPLIETSENDPLAALAAKVSKALPAPTKAAAKK